MKQGKNYFFPVCRSYRARAVYYRVCNLTIWRTCAGCPFRRKRRPSRHECAFHSLPEFRAGVIRKREEKRQERAAFREYAQFVAEVFSRGKK